MTEYNGTSLAPGFFSGRLLAVAGLARFSATLAQQSGSVDAEVEWNRFEIAATELAQVFAERAADLSQKGLSEEAGIVHMHLALLESQSLRESVAHRIHRSGLTAAAAVEQGLESMARRMETADDRYLCERAADFRDLALQLLERLSGQTWLPTGLALQESRVIVLTEEILPSLVLDAWRLGIGGIVVRRGTALSHAAIIAQSVGIPVVRLDEVADLSAWNGLEAVVDGYAGTVMLEPSDETVRAAPPTDSAAWRGATTLPAALSLSVIAPEQLVNQDWRGLQGIGLYRTEMLFLQHSDRFLSENEQFQVYRRLFELCGDRKIVVRTVDLGADKAVPHMHFGPEMNPYLGLRAHRLFHYHPEILITQLRAVLRAAAGQHELHILFPMLETVDQWNFVNELLDQALRSLRAGNPAIPNRIHTGILIETPAAVWQFPELIERADFASVGTNDLVQYTFAVERDAPNVAQFCQPEHPVMLRVLRQLVRQAAVAGKPLSICGAIASEPRFLPLLIGLGFDDLSVAAAQADRVGQALTELDAGRCLELAEACLAMQTASEVRTLYGFTAHPGDAGNSGALAIDPVCGMTVRIESATCSLDSGSVWYYFCSAHCKEQYSGTAAGF